MLDLEDIIKYYPERLHDRNLALYREYLQYQILDICFSSKYASKLSFLGGTALRIVHENNRFSEDIGFDFTNLSYNEFQELGKLIQKELELLGFKIELRFVEKQAFHCYIKLPDVMYKYGLSPLVDQKILIQLDAVSHGYQYEKEIATLNKFGIFSEILVTPKDILLSQKFWVILNRKRQKGRDYYDIIFLLGFASPDYGYLKLKAGISNLSELKDAVLEHTKDFDFDYLVKDVSPFVFDQSGAERISRFRELIGQMG